VLKIVDFKLDRAQRKLQKRARKFALEEILPVVNYFDEMDTPPKFLLEKAHAAGLNNLGIPKKYGGHGYGLLDSSLVVEEVAAACPAMGTSIFGNSLGQEPLIFSGNDWAKEKYLTTCVNEPKIVSFATSEPGMGSDVAGIRCKAEKDGEDYILNGTKYWVTNGGYADYASIFATVDPKLRHKGLCGFFIEMDWDGITVGEHIPKLGQRVSSTTAIHFDNVRVPASNVIALPGTGFLLAMKTFSATRPIIGSFAVGAARSAMEFAMDYAEKRRAFTMKLSEFEAVQFKLAEMYQKIEASRLMIWKSAWEADQGKDNTLSASITKFYSTEAAQEVLNDALQIFAGYGFTRFYPIEKLLRDIRVLTIYEGTSEVQRLVVYRYLSKLKRTMPPLEDLPRLRADDVEQAAREGLKQQTAWRCRICGYTHYGEEPPDHCPYCFFPKTAFKKTWPK
jgi:acyl-CoA dehydrogenase